MRFGLVLPLLLAGCDNLPQARTETEIREIAREEADFAGDKVIALEARIAALEESAIRDRAFMVETYNAHESLRKTFNGNVDQTNREKVANMTARGACGTRLVNLPNGGYYNERIECTEKDLR